jgi:hypothetical protein
MPVTIKDYSNINMGVWAYRAGEAEGAAAPPPHNLLDKQQSQSSNIRFTVGQYYIILY